MSLEQTREFLGEAVEALDERVGATRLFVNVEYNSIMQAGSTADAAMKGMNSWADQFAVFELQKVPRELAKRIRLRKGDATKNWKAAKRYAKRAVVWGDGFDDAKDAEDFHRVKR